MDVDIVKSGCLVVIPFSASMSHYFKSITLTATTLLEYDPDGSEGNCLSSSISGFLTRETITGDNRPKYGPKETMKTFKSRFQILCESSVRQGQTNLINLVEKRHPRLSVCGVKEYAFVPYYFGACLSLLNNTDTNSNAFIYCRKTENFLQQLEIHTPRPPTSTSATHTPLRVSLQPHHVFCLCMQSPHRSAYTLTHTSTEFSTESHVCVIRGWKSVVIHTSRSAPVSCFLSKYFRVRNFHRLRPCGY